MLTLHKFYSISSKFVRGAQPCITSVMSMATAPSSKEASLEDKAAAATDESEKAKDPKNAPKLYEPASLELGLEYLKSKAYQITYGNQPVWQSYRRNHKGHIPPSRTRISCVRKGVVSTGNPCPICRDEYLVIHPQNVDLLKQFISPHSGNIHSSQTTGVCQRQHNKMLVAFEQAQDMGLIKVPLPFRTYNYADYYKQSKVEENNKKQ